MPSPSITKSGQKLSRRKRRVTSNLVRLLLAFALLTYFCLAVPRFASAGNFYALLQSFANVGLVTLGLALTMISGEFDLSVASMVAVAGLIAVKLGELNPWLGAGAAVAFGALVGIGDALLFYSLGISSLVVTLGVMILLNGLAFWLAGGRVVTYSNFEVGEFLDRNIFLIFSARSLLTVCAFVLVSFLLQFTKVGRDIYATGSHRHAATVSGVRVTFSLMTAFGFSGAFAALAGTLLSFSLATGSATLGGDTLLQAASAAILGGVALTGGVGSAGGAALGALILATLNNGLSLTGANSATILLTNGTVLLAVVLWDGRVSEIVRDAFKKAEAQRARAINEPATGRT
jgi:ribose/xylose/arabinose/galactoside ABC-type transport system permease subunit